MSKLLDALLGGATFEQALDGASKELQKIANRKPRKFKTNNKNGYHTTELYPDIEKLQPKINK